MSAKQPDKAAIDAYLAAVDVKGAIGAMSSEGKKIGGLRGAYFEGLGVCFAAMWDLVQEILGRGEPVPYERCVIGSTGKSPEPSHPEGKRRRVAELLAKAGYPSKTGDELLTAVDAWRARADGARQVHPDARRRLDRAVLRRHGEVPRSAPSAGALRRAPGQHEVPADQGRLVLRLDELHRPRAQARRHVPSTRPRTRSTRRSRFPCPEFAQLVSHEVVPGPRHDVGRHPGPLRRGKRLGFEATVLTMNSRGAALMRGDRQQRDPDRATA